ncbi:MAG: DUF4384 domain-containing protein, partial [Sulfurovaceae bacterium]|nr:DUF4384 domain-containing protein [Sulfurovaceae bacterium]
MLKTALSTITAMLITISSLNAETNRGMSLTMGTEGVSNIEKGMAVIPKQSKNYSQPTQTYQEGNPYQNQSYQDETPYQPISAPKPTKISGSFADTILYAKAVKGAYRVNEPIRIQFKLKRDAYIYFWTISQDGRGYLILPNSFDGSAKHKAYKHYVIPNNSADYQFISDRAGIEHLYVLATNKRISKKKIESIFNQKVGGVIPRATASNISHFVTKD